VDWYVLARFLLATLFVLMTPGPVMAIVAHNTLRHGTTSDFLTAIGVELGRLCLLGAMFVGLTMSIGFSPGLFRWLSLLGAFYLVWLAVDALRFRDLPLRSPISLPSRRPIVNGLTVAFGNPVALLFYAVFFPQFIDSDHSIVEQMSALGAGYLCTALAFDFACVMTVACVRLSVDWTRFGSLSELGSAAVYFSIAVFTVARLLGTSS